jgi:hypothetical protein
MASITNPRLEETAKDLLAETKECVTKLKREGWALL